MATSASALALPSAGEGLAAGRRREERDLVTSLPYIDNITPGERELVKKLIEEEAKRGTKRPADYLKETPLPPLLKFEDNPCLAKEMKRVADGEAMPGMDVARLALPQPPSSKRNDVSAWRSALDNAYSQLEHQYNRLLNLELLLQYGPAVWQAHVAHLEVAVKQMEAAREAVKQEIETVNRERKLKQERRAQLRSLEQTWLSQIHKNAEIETACHSLEAALSGLCASLLLRKGGTGSTAEGATEGPAQQDAGPPASEDDAKPRDEDNERMANGTVAAAEGGPAEGGPLPDGNARDGEEGPHPGPPGTPELDGAPHAAPEPMDET